MASVNHTPVAVIGAGPAGLMLSHLLHQRGVDSVVFEARSRETVEATVRAGVLEQGTMRLMRETGLGERMDREADIDEAIDISVDGRRTRIELTELTGYNMAVYPQHEVLIDLIAQREKDNGTVLFNTRVDDVTGYDDDIVTVSYTGPDGAHETLTCDYVVVADGSASPWRGPVTEVAGGARYRHEYPYAWFGILVNAPQTQKELIYANHDDGFALISTRSETVQRYYLQCDPEDTVEMWSDDRIWQALHTRVDSDGLTVSGGEIFDKAVLRFRSAVTAPMQRGRLFLAGDAAHTVPPTGAKGLNLAVADVVALVPGLVHALDGDDRRLQGYTELALPRVWKAQHFSFWMSSMLHHSPKASPFEAQRRKAELSAVLGSEAGRRFLAQQYVGADLPDFRI
jgi:p-hydroxybenzoate 3-monooxygenase